MELGLKYYTDLSRLDAEVVWILAEGLDEEAVLPLVHVLALLDHPEHGLEHLHQQHRQTHPGNKDNHARLDLLYLVNKQLSQDT